MSFRASTYRRLPAGFIAVAVLLPLACSGGRKGTRDDAAAKPAMGSDATGRDAAGHDATFDKRTAQGGHAAAAGKGTVNVVVHWPKPPPAAFVAAPPCLGADDAAPMLTTTRLVVGALVQLDGTATVARPAGAPVVFVISDCAVRPAVAVAALKTNVHLRSNGHSKVATMQHVATVADRRVVQFPIIGHTVEVSGLALGTYIIAGDDAAVAAGTLVVTDHAAAVSNGDGRVQFTAAPGPHRIFADLPAVGPRAAVHAELVVHVVAGEEITADLNFGAP
ncbi:MAG: hypothetical protein KBG15_09475 [Kofleriaceae bacterium]|nr:hypothetical protein [Kofleriaceae bacterium]